MTLDSEGNFDPWVQPKYGFNAEDVAVVAPPEYVLLEKNVKILPGDIPFDVYSGWLWTDQGGLPKNNWYSKNGCHTSSEGRWTTWARPQQQ